MRQWFGNTKGEKTDRMRVAVLKVAAGPKPEEDAPGGWLLDFFVQHGGKSR